MENEPRTILIEPDSETAGLLDEASTTPLRLEKDGIRYRLTREGQEEIRADYDPDKVVEAIDKLAGSLSDMEADALIAAIYKAREEGSRPADRPQCQI